MFCCWNLFNFVFSSKIYPNLYNFNHFDFFLYRVNCMYGCICIDVYAHIYFFFTIFPNHRLTQKSSNSAVCSRNIRPFCIYTFMYYTHLYHITNTNKHSITLTIAHLRDLLLFFSFILILNLIQYFLGSSTDFIIFKINSSILIDKKY